MKRRGFFAWPLAFTTTAAIAREEARDHALPDKPISLVVPGPAGGATDEFARGFAARAAPALDRPIVIVNLPGGSGVIAARKVLHAEPDGATLLFGSANELLLMPMSARPAVGYAWRDFTPIAKLGSTPLALVARPGAGWASVGALVAAARERPQSLSVGYTGARSLQALAAEEFALAKGVRLLRVPYLGGPQLLNDLASGQIDLAVAALPGVMAQVRAAGLRLLGLLSTVQAATDVGLPGIYAPSGQAVRGGEVWAGLLAPSGIPGEAADRLFLAVREVLADPAFRQARRRLGSRLEAPGPPDRFAGFLEAEERRLHDLLNAMQATRQEPPSGG